MPFVSCRFAGATSIASGMAYLSTAIRILTPRTFLPRSKQLDAEERVAGNVAKQPDRLPLHAAQADTPDCQHRPAQRRSGQRWLASWSLWPVAVRGHRREFVQHRVDGDVHVGKGVP
jgi:hypothetical protein